MRLISARAVIAISIVTALTAAFKIGILIDDIPRHDVRHDVIDNVMHSNRNILGLNAAMAPNVSLIWQNLGVTHNALAAGAVCQLMSEGARGLISVLHPSSCMFVTDQTRVYNLPHVALPLGDCTGGGTSNVNLQLSSLAHVPAEIMRDVAVYEDWREVVLLFDETADMETRARCLMLLSNSIIPASIVTINRGDDRDKLTEDMRSISWFVAQAILMLCSAENVKRVFQEAAYLNMTTARHYWVVFDEGETAASSINADVLRHTNILFVRRPRSKSRPCDKPCQGHDNCTVFDRIAKTENMSLMEAVLADAVLRFVLTLNKMAVRGDVFESEDIVTCSARPTASIPNGLEIQTALNQTSLNGFICFGGFIEQELRRLILSNADGNASLQHVANWNTEHALALIGHRLFLKAFVDFNGRRLRVATKESAPFAILVTRGNETVFTGFCFDILDELALRLNFTYDAIEVPDGFYGGPNGDGTWNGMVGMVLRGDVDMAVAALTITSLRETVIDFTIPFIQESTGILTKLPDIESQEKGKLLKLFYAEVWAVIGGAIVVVGFVSFCVNRLTPFSAWRRKFPESSEDEVTLSGNMWTVYRCIVAQGAKTHPRALSGMVILASWWAFMIIIIAAYTANLAGILTVTLPFKPINSLAELVAQQTIRPLILAGTNLVDLFTNVESDIYHQVGDMMDGMPSVAETVDALKLVDSGQYAFMTDLSQLEKYADQNCTAYALADETFNMAGLAFVVPENARYREAINLNIRIMHESGLIERWRQHWWPHRHNCGAHDRTPGGVVGLQTMYGPLLIYIGTVGVAVVLLALQKIVHCVRVKIEKQRSRSFTIVGR